MSDNAHLCLSGIPTKNDSNGMISVIRFHIYQTIDNSANTLCYKKFRYQIKLYDTDFTGNQSVPLALLTLNFNYKLTALTAELTSSPPQSSLLVIP